MKQIFQNSTARLWCLSGLIAMTLMAGVPFEDSQAHTIAPPPVTTSIQSNSKALTESAHIEKTTRLISSKTQHRTGSVTHKQVERNAEGKKRMGLGMLVLGILAEKS